MRRAAAVVTALVVLVAAVVALRGPDVTSEPLAVAVPARPGSASTVQLDAALHLPESLPAPAVLLAHGFGSDRTALADAAVRYAARGYVALTWSARGFGASGGVVGLDDPDREVADVSALIDLLSGRAEVAHADGDPVVGIAGGSYGGGLALLAASEDPRIDAVVAAGAWHSLTRALSPGGDLGQPGVLKEQWLAALFASAVADAPAEDPSVEDPRAEDPRVEDPAPTSGTPAQCGRADPELCAAYVATMEGGRLTDQARLLLDRAAVDGRADDITAPTLLIAGISDTLFPLTESLETADELAGEVALRWIAGGHGTASRVDGPAALDWFDLHLRGLGEPAPTFTWTDAVGDVDRAADELPIGAEGTSTLQGVLGPAGRLVLDGAGSDEPGTDAEPVRPGTAVVLSPPGGVPAAISSLPGLADVGNGLTDLLPDVELPGQRAAWASPPLDADTTLLGSPALALDVTASGPMVLFAAVHDVSPGGRATLLGAAVTPIPVPAGRTRVQVPLHPLARRVVAGNRIRVSLGTTDLAHALPRQAAVAQLSGGAVVLPTADVVNPPTIPVAARLLLPVALVLALAGAAALATRRREARLAAEPAADEPAIVVRDLVKRYADGKVAVDGLDLIVERGQVFGLLGPNGAGKTTTMRMLLGLISPTQGEVRLLGHRLRAGHPVLERVGVLVEGPGFAPYLTGRQNLESWWRAGGRPLAAADWDRALAVADLGGALDVPVRTYSHGMRQRLAIAQALLGHPELLVLDEPTDGLDPEQIRSMRRLLAQLGEEGMTVLVSSHLLAEVEQMCTHAAVVQDGRVIASGPVSDLQGATRSMVLQVGDRNAARVVLAGLDPAPQVDVEGSGLVVHLDATDAATVIATLVAAGIEVSAATPRGRLEDTFLALTGGAR